MLDEIKGILGFWTVLILLGYLSGVAITGAELGSDYQQLDFSNFGTSVVSLGKIMFFSVEGIPFYISLLVDIIIFLTVFIFVMLIRGVG